MQINLKKKKKTQQTVAPFSLFKAGLLTEEMSANCGDYAKSWSYLPSEQRIRTSTT